MGAGEAVRAPRLHFEDGVVQAEPGIDEAALARLEARGLAVARRPAINLFFGGVQAVARDPATGALSGGGDPRRGGAVAYAIRAAERWRADDRLRGRGPARRARGRGARGAAGAARAARRRRRAAGGAARGGRRRAPDPAAGRAGAGRRRAALHAARDRRDRRRRPRPPARASAPRSASPTPTPTSRSLTEADLEAARRMKAFLDAGLPEDGMLQVARTIGMGTARIAEANRELVVRTLTQPGDTERDLALRFAAAAEHMMPLVEPTLVYALQRPHARADPPRRDRRRRPRLGRDRRHRRPRRLLRRPGRVHPPRRGDRARGAGLGRRPLRGDGERRRRAAGAAGEDDRRRGDARLHRARADARRGAAS